MSEFSSGEGTRIYKGTQLLFQFQWTLSNI